MFIEPEATTAPRPVRREPARPEPRLTPAPVEPELEEAVASEPRRALSRKDRERIAEFHSEADVFIKYGLLDNAINRLESALALDPDDIKARLRLRDLFMKSNRQADAIEQLGIAAQILERTDKLDKAEKLYRDILKLDPTNATIEAKLQQLLNMQAAQPALQETPTRPTASAGPRPAPAAPVRPSAPSAESPFTSKEFAQELQKLADDLFAGEPELATQADDMSQEVALATPPQQRDRIDVAVEDVIEEFRKGVAKTISSKDFETHYNLGIAYKEMGLVDAAIEEFRVVLNFPEMVVESCDHLGLCYIDKGELDKAVRILDFGVRMARHDPERRRGLRYDLAKALRIQGDSARALELLREVYQEDPGFADVAAQIKDLQNQIG